MSEDQDGWSSAPAGDAQGSPTDPDGVAPPRSPFARPPGYQGSIGYGPPLAPAEPRFAGAPYGSAHAGAELPAADFPTAEFPTAEFPTAEFLAADGATAPIPPWQPPGALYAPPEQWGAPEPGPPRRRKPLVLVAVLVLALIAGGTTIGIVSSDSKSSNTPAADPNLPSPLNSAAPSQTPAPSASPSPNTFGSPTNPLPNVGVPTPPGLLAIGYHAYSSGLREPADVAIDAAEEVQFKKDGLQRIVGLNALTLGAAGVTTDDYDADISILRFKDAAGAKSEVDYSNMRNKQDAGATLVSLPGLPDVTAFLNKDADTGESIGAFASVGRYQVVLILGGLSPNVPTNTKVLAAETARVMKALLATAATIEPQDSGSPTDPLTPSQAPSEAPSEVPTEPALPAPSATPSGIHA